MSKCILCGANAVLNIQESASRTIYNCPNCGVFVISDLVTGEVEANKSKIASFLANRNFSGNNDIVMISLENVSTDKSYVHMTVKQIVDEFPDSAVRRINLSLQNLVNKSEYPGYEIKIESLRSGPLFYLEKVNFDSIAFAIKSLERRGLVTVNHYGASSSFLPCGVVVTPEGWDVAICAEYDASAQDEAFISVANRQDYSQDYLKAAMHSCKICGYNVVDALTIGSESAINNRLIANIRKSRFIICDLSEGSPHSYFVAGMAKALNKTAIFTCRSKDKRKLKIDLNQMNVIFWDDCADLGDYINDTIRALVV